LRTWMGRAKIAGVCGDGAKADLEELERLAGEGGNGVEVRVPGWYSERSWAGRFGRIVNDRRQCEDGCRPERI
jgi:hypothetical protein